MSRHWMRWFGLRPVSLSAACTCRIVVAINGGIMTQGWGKGSGKILTVRFWGGKVGGHWIARLVCGDPAALFFCGLGRWEIDLPCWCSVS